MIVSAILFALLILVGFLWMASMVSGMMQASATPAGPHLREAVLERADTSDRILLIRLEGIIAGDRMGYGGFGLPALIREQLDQAAKNHSVKAVVLAVDSPGGEVLASDEIAEAIEAFQTTTGKPVVASMQSVAASGGYYVSAPCRWIVANELTITGSIGVILSSYNYRELMDKVGVSPQVFKSGKFKDMLSPSRKASDISDEERAMVQNLVDTSFDKFKEVIKAGRDAAAQANQNTKPPGRSLRPDWEDFADGRILSGEQALEIGLVDEVGNLAAAKARARALAGIPDAAVIEYQPLFDLGSFLRLLGRAPSTQIKVDVGPDLPKLKAGRLYFLAPSFLQ